MVKPNVVMVELCVGRVNIIHLDEETLLEEAKNINMEKIRLSIKQVNYPKIKYYILYQENFVIFYVKLLNVHYVYKMVIL